MLKKGIFLVALAIIVSGGYYAYNHYAAGLYYLAGQYDRMMNPYGVDPDAPEPSEEDRVFHRSMFIADLHADTLKWERDLLERSTFGHADVPRLREGNVSLQGFTIVTKSPLRIPWSNSISGRSPDTNTLLSILQRRPVFDLRARAFYQIDRFKEAVERSRETPGTELRLIETADDLRRLVQDRRAGRDVIGGFLGIEGGHWIGGPDADHADVRADMQELFDAGVRMFAPSHRFDNNLSGSNEGYDRYGLTSQGMTALATAEELGIMVDVAHISTAGLRDAANLLEQPFNNSHTGIRANCEEPCRPDRNLSDDEIRAIIANDGVIGVGYWPQAIGPSVWRIADVMAHIMEIAAEMGVEDPSRHVALGSDYDGSVTPMIEVSHLDVLTTIMRQRPEPFHEDQIRNISGGNICRILATVLPGGSAEKADAICTDLEVPVTTSPADAEGSTGAGADTLSAPRLAVMAPSLAPTEMVAWVARTKSEMNHWLRGNLAAAGGGGALGAFLIIGVGFLYGLLHSAGPGHGKLVVGSYFLAHPDRPVRAVILSIAIAMLQATTAIILVGGLVLVAEQTIVRMLDQAGAVEAVAYALVIAFGIMLLAQAVRGTPGCNHCRHHGSGHRHPQRFNTRPNRLAMALAIGLRPCSGALALLLFTLPAGQFSIGVLATLAMGLGAAITVSLSAVAALSLRAVVRDSAGRLLGDATAGRLAPAAATSIQITAALLITLVGSVFLAAAVLQMGVL